MEFITDSKPHGYFALLYGVPGIGKTSEAGLAESPVFLDCEGGIAILAKSFKQRYGKELVRTEKKIETFNEFLDSLSKAAKSDFKTIVIDTVTALEQILTTEVLTEFNAGRPDAKKITSISQIPYGGGGELLAARWSYVMKLLTKAQLTYSKNIILVGHSTVRKVEDPTTENYDKFTLDVHKKSEGIIVSNVDAVFFCRQRTYIKEKKNDSKHMAVTDGERIITCVDQPSFLAKNRFNIIEDVPMGGKIYEIIREVLAS